MTDLEIQIMTKTLQELLHLLKTDKVLFFSIYRALPFELFKEIEKLSISKSLIYKDFCRDARKITTAFHSNAKFINKKSNL